jgi:hypothetical protein
MQKLYALKRPKTNIQILQQNVLLKYKYEFYSTFYLDVKSEISILFACFVQLALPGSFRIERLRFKAVFISNTCP